jgi:ubiquinone/menaquinone biosynthesis C-methylase UbiE
MQRKALTHERVFRDAQYAAEYARQHQKMGENLGKRVSRSLRKRGFEQGRIIDAGCGSGATAVYLADAFPGCEIVGIDLSEPLLQEAAASAEAVGVSDRVRFEVGDAEQLTFDEQSFDVALSFNMAHIVEHPVQMLDELERILRRDGHLFIADLKRSWLSIFEREMASSFTLSEAQDLFRQSRIREGKFSSDLIWWRFEA